MVVVGWEWGGCRCRPGSVTILQIPHMGGVLLVCYNAECRVVASMINFNFSSPCIGADTKRVQ